MPKPTLRAVAIPAEHGGWSLTLEPVILGLLVAPSASGFALGMVALLIFMSRTPGKIALVDRKRDHWRARSQWALLVAGVEVVLIVLFGVVAIATARAAFWWPLAVAAPLIAVELTFDIRSRSRRLAPELAGAAGVGSMAAAIALTAGATPGVATGLWLVIAARSVAAVSFVRVQLRRAKGQEYRVRHSDAGQLVAIGIAATGLALDFTPALAVGAVVFVALFDVIMVRRSPPPVPVLGSQQIVLGLLLVVVTGLAVRAP